MVNASDNHRFPPALLVTTGQPLGSLLGAARGLGRRGVPVYVAGFASDITPLAASRYCRAAVNLPFDGSSEFFQKSLRQWWPTTGEKAQPVILPFSDQTAACLAECRHDLAGTFDRICVARSDLVSTLLDKRKSQELACRHGLFAPEAGTATTFADIEELAGRLKFPVIVKPLSCRHRGALPFKTEVYDTPEVMRVRGRRLIEAGAILDCQEYVPGGDESIEAYLFYRSADGETIHGSAALKTRQFQPGAGIMAAGHTAELAHVVEMTNAFLKEVDYRGLGGIEFKRYQDRSWFIEVNPRMEAIHPLAQRAGVDLAWLAYADLALDQLERRPIPFRHAWYLDGAAYQNLVRRHRHEVPAIRELLRLLIRPGLKCAIWDCRDPLPWLAINRSMIASTSGKTWKRLGGPGRRKI
ncbi:hypothetical protein HQ520_04740 [bacterium]|nr:hypothetical protein [bacterium]